MTKFKKKYDQLGHKLRFNIQTNEEDQENEPSTQTKEQDTEEMNLLSSVRDQVQGVGAPHGPNNRWRKEEERDREASENDRPVAL